MLQKYFIGLAPGILSKKMILGFFAWDLSSRQGEQKRTN
jgi:hypothetical protein